MLIKHVLTYRTLYHDTVSDYMARWETRWSYGYNAKSGSNYVAEIGSDLLTADSFPRSM